MSDAPVIVAEVTAADWSAAGPGWTHLPYLARFRADRLPASWDAFFTGRHHAVLESGRTGSLTIAVPAAPRATLFFADGRVVVHAEDGAHEETTEKPLAYLRRWSREVRAPRLAGWPAFQGGLIALLGYELATQIEPVRSAPADVRVPLAAFLEAHEACVFDAAKHELTVVVLCPFGSPNTALREARARALALAARWSAACAVPSPTLPPSATPAQPLAASFDEPGFVRAVARCQEYIAAGDTYQVNLSTRLEVPPVDTLRAYEALRSANPSPYMGFVRLPGVSLACGSPELLVEVADGRVASRPIAGTRPRGADEAADLAWARELSGDTKEKAEHLMLVDLLRNDVGRVSRPGTARDAAEWLPRPKSAPWANSMAATIELRSLGVGAGVEGVQFDARGFVSEGSRSSLAWVEGGVLHVPAESTGRLPGTALGQLIHCAGLPVRAVESAVPVRAEVVLLLRSTLPGGAAAVSHWDDVDGRPLWSGDPAAARPLLAALAAWRAQRCISFA